VHSYSSVEPIWKIDYDINYAEQKKESLTVINFSHFTKQVSKLPYKGQQTSLVITKVERKVCYCFIIL